MTSQEVQTLSCLLRNKTGLIGTFPKNQPKKIVFALENGTELRLLGFNHCHPSIVPELGQKRVAGFGRGKGEKQISPKNWETLAGTANAVLFTRKGRKCEVEILTGTVAENRGGVLTVTFKKTGKTDWFVP